MPRQIRPQGLATQHLPPHSVSESGKQKKAVVQWFVRVSEVPLSKLKLLGREPHPQEIFYYQGHNCDDEVDVGSILRPVQVMDEELPQSFCPVTDTAFTPDLFSCACRKRK